MLETLKLAKRVALVDTTVLVLGETGVGKEEVAKFIHKQQPKDIKISLRSTVGQSQSNSSNPSFSAMKKVRFLEQMPMESRDSSKLPAVAPCS